MQAELGIPLARLDVTVSCGPPNRKLLTIAYRLLLIATFQIGTVTSISWAPYQFHLLVMSTFASLVAPFGGFFASGFKRAFNIKDFGDSIPGHGGMTDRMDCQYVFHTQSSENSSKSYHIKVLDGHVRLCLLQYRDSRTPCYSRRDTARYRKWLNVGRANAAV